MEKFNLEKLQSITLLLVEDEDVIRELMYKMVTRIFNEVYVAANGLEGFELYKKYKPDLVLTDVNMPIKSGLDMSRDIKNLNQSTPIIIASAYYDQDILLNAIEIGVDKYLTKPIRKDKLITALMQSGELILKNKTIKAKNLYIQVLFDSNPDIVIVTNGENIQNANKSFFEFFKEFNSLEDFKQKYNCIDDLFEKVEKYGYVYQNIENQNWIKYILNSKKENYKAIIKREDVEFVFMLSIKQIEVLDGIEYIVNLTDITNIENYKKTLEDKIQKEIEENRKKDQLMFHQSRLAQMGEMINMIAHQWRQPLNVITSATIDISLENELETLTKDNLNKSLKHIENQAKKMSETINDFMNFFKPTKEKEVFKFVNLFKDIENLISAQFVHREIKFIIDVDEELEYVGYKNELEQVLLNLVNNSRDAFEEKKAENKFVKVNVVQNKGRFWIFIQDNAGGIAENVIDKIFNPYFSTKEEGKGTGIGLYISKNILEKSFKGFIRVENILSEFGKGAKFTIII